MPLSHSPTSRISCPDQPEFNISVSALSDFQDHAEWSLQASRVPSVLSSLFTSPRVQICRGVQCIITTWTWHGPNSSLVRSTGANARTQSLTQMRYQMATLISACMTGTWVGRYPLCHRDLGYSMYTVASLQGFRCMTEPLRCLTMPPRMSKSQMETQTPWGKRICDSRCTSDSRVTGGCRKARKANIPLCPRVCAPKRPDAVIGRRLAFENMIRRKGRRVE